MSHILIFRHVSHEGPGYLETFLQRHDLGFTLISVDAGEAVPASLTDVSGLVFMGGPMSVNDDLPWIPQEISLIQQALDRDLPILGHCLGAQLIAKALGEAITPNDPPEIGWLPVTIVDQAAGNGWLQALPAEFEVFHWHGETFSLPTGAQRILSSSHCQNQGFSIGKTLALQPHVEMTAELVRLWIEKDAAALHHPTVTVQTPAQMTEQLDRRIQRLQQIADGFYGHWVEGLQQ